MVQLSSAPSSITEPLAATPKAATCGNG
ncbi:MULTISPECIES: tail fiber protein [Escherichia]|nr:MULTISPECIES: tail fiber protein [Escherichia]